MAAYQDNAWNVRYRELFEAAQRHFVAVDLDHAQVVFYPHMYTDCPPTREAIQLARSRGLPLVFLRTGDWPDPIQLPYGVVYRHSIFASERAPGELAMPAFCEDMLLAHAGRVTVRKKQTVPTVGFRGYVGNRLMHAAYRLLGRKQKALGLELRARLLDKLSRRVDIACHFWRSDRFMGGTAGILNPDPRVAARVRGDYIQSLLDSDYTLCVRGAGNFSYRFYEVLSAGRIPVYVNTDAILPYEGEIDWKRHCVWVEADEMDRIGERVLDFHRSLDENAFEELQRSNRRLWGERLTPLTFYRSVLTKAVETAPVASLTP
jgi:hypothetical protein